MQPLTATLDADSQEMAPSQLWGDIFGETCGPHWRTSRGVVRGGAISDIYSPSVMTDSGEITPETVRTIRCTSAPGAFDLSRRLKVLDS